MYIDSTTKILIAVFIALVVIAIFSYDGTKQAVGTRVTLTQSTVRS